MSATPPDPSRATRDALVVASDGEARTRLSDQVRLCGFGVMACESLPQAQSVFGHQSALVLHVPDGDGAASSTEEVSTFVDYVRSTAPAESQPAIVAIGGEQARIDLALGGLNRVLSDPADTADLKSALAAAADAPAFATGEHLRLLFDTAPIAVAMFDRQQRVLAANRAWKDHFNLEGKPALGQRLADLDPGTFERWRPQLESALKGEEAEADESMTSPDGDATTPCRWNFRQWSALDGIPGGVIVTQALLPTSGLPPSPAPQADMEGAETTDQTAGSASPSISSLPVPAWECDSDGLLTETNDAWDEVFGESTGAPVSLTHHLAEEDRPTVAEAVSLSVVEGVPLEWEGNALLPSGDQKTVRYLGTPSTDGRLVGITLVLPEIAPADSHESGQAKAPDAPQTEPTPILQVPTPQIRVPEGPIDLGKSLEALPDGVFVLGQAGEVLFHNGWSESVFPNPPLGLPLVEWMMEDATDGDHRLAITDAWETLIHEARPYATTTLPLATTTDGVREFELAASTVDDSGYIVTFRDVTIPNRLAAALRTSEESSVTTLRNCGIPIAIVDQTGDVSRVSVAFETLFQVSGDAVFSGGIDRFFDEESRAVIQMAKDEVAALAEGNPWHTVRGVRPDGTGFEASLRASLVPAPSAVGGAAATAFTVIPTSEAI